VIGSVSKALPVSLTLERKNVTKSEYAQYINSSHWKTVRTFKLKATDWCERCYMPRWLANIAFDQDLNVHHISYERIGRELLRDLEVLCRRCHEVETFGRSDLREPKYADCTLCDTRHWNVYSDRCEVCRDLTASASLHPGLFHSPTRYGTSPVWAGLVENAIYGAGEDAVLDLLASVSEFRRKQAEQLRTALPFNDEVPF
jgi:hypothetical protein